MELEMIKMDILQKYRAEIVSIRWHTIHYILRTFRHLHFVNFADMRQQFRKVILLQTTTDEEQVAWKLRPFDRPDQQHSYCLKVIGSNCILFILANESCR